MKYSLLSNEADQLPFQLDEDSGRLSVVEPGLDFEARRSYAFEVVARDNGTPSLATSVDVAVKVRDVNDCRPRVALKSLHDNVTLRCQGDVTTKCTASVSEAEWRNVFSEEGIVTVGATDDDVAKGNAAPFKFNLDSQLAGLIKLREKTFESVYTLINNY